MVQSATVAVSVSLGGSVGGGIISSSFGAASSSIQFVQAAQVVNLLNNVKIQ